MTRRDFVDGLVAQWERERPDLMPTPMGVFGRISRIARHIEAALLAILPAQLIMALEVLSAPKRLQLNHFGAARVRWAEVLFHRATFHPV